MEDMECFGLQFDHGHGLFLHERPIISRLVSMDSPMEIKEGMVFELLPGERRVLKRTHRGRSGRHQ